MAKKRILILGGGLAGLSVAWHLQEKGIGCHLFEKETEVGGLCRSKHINGFTFDCSGHLLHFRHKYTFNLVKSFLGNNLSEHKRSAWIYSCKRFTRYPFQANLYGLPHAIVKKCLSGFIETLHNGKMQKEKNQDFSTWIKQTFGEGIATYFMVPYNTKFWTVSPRELTCEWLDGFIPVPSLQQVIDGTIEESQRQFGYNAHFWYPKKGGISQLPKAMAAQLKNVHTGCRIAHIDLRKKIIKTSQGNRERFDYLVSSLPLPELAYCMKKLPQEITAAFKKLRWNSIYNLNLGIEKADSDGKHWVYFPENEVCFFRSGFPHNFSRHAAPEGKGSVYVEVSYSRDKPIDKDAIVSRIKEGLKHARILTQDSRIYNQDINDIAYGYPIYDSCYHQAREEIIRYLLQNDVLPCGRYGSWKYMSMEDVILEGKTIATQLENKICI